MEYIPVSEREVSLQSFFLNMIILNVNVALPAGQPMVNVLNNYKVRKKTNIGNLTDGQSEPVSPLIIHPQCNLLLRSAPQRLH